MRHPRRPMSQEYAPVSRWWCSFPRPARVSPAPGGTPKAHGLRGPGSTRLRQSGETNLERYQVEPGRCCVLGWAPTSLVRVWLFR
jgi:hypothetical protein